jgi:cytochrome oxidase Cu insertion factor (SCO1/SenC/PrrC family)
MVGLTGSKEQIDQVARAYRVHVSAGPPMEGNPNDYIGVCQTEMQLALVLSGIDRSESLRVACSCNHYVFASIRAKFNFYCLCFLAVDHSIIEYLIDPQGVFAAFFGQNRNADEMSDDITKYVRNWKPRSPEELQEAQNK